jgi:hypothetical protein
MGRLIARNARRAASLALATGLVVAAASACSDDATTAGTPPPLATGTAAPPRDAGPTTEAAASVDASVVDAGPQSRVFTGTLAATATTAFGGEGYCNYRVTMKSVEVSVTVTQAGDIANAAVTSLAVEETVPPCPHPPLPPNVHKYYLASSSKLPAGGSHLELARDPLNRPEATLVLEGDFRADTVKAALEWHRTDIGPPFDWRVTTTVSLTRR